MSELIERSNPPVEAIGRNVRASGRLDAFHCMGSDVGSERAAAFHSLMETAKLNGLDPHADLRKVVARIVEHLIDRMDDLLLCNAILRLAA